jgi:hypothetical protein
MTTAQDVIKLAQQELGYVETPVNRTKYGTWYGMDKQPWCAMFVSYCFYFSELPLPIKNKKGFAYCPDGVNWFKQQNRFFDDPQPGDVVFFDWPTDQVFRAQHVGIVESINADGSVKTIEGNTSSSNDSNGGRVMQRTRKRSLIVGFGRPNYDDRIVFPEGVPPQWEGRYITLTSPFTQGKDVMQFQRRLIELGYPVGTSGSTGKGDDGIFGEESFKTLKQFQQEHGLEVDGVLGAESWYKAWKLLEPALV